MSELKWGSEGEEGLREAWVATKEMRDLGLDNNYIYKGYFCNFRETGFYPGQVSGRVSDFFIKPRPFLGFFKKTHTRPYSQSDQVKLGLLGSGRAGYPRVGQKLPSLKLHWFGAWVKHRKEEFQARFVELILPRHKTPS